jgi:hypothetical protein
MKKKAYLLGLAVLTAALLALPGVGQSAMWVGAELGINNVMDTTFNVPGRPSASTAMEGPQVLGGLTIGYDFVNAGFGAYAWPDWMKYFSIATDLTYNRMGVRQGSGGLGDLMPGKTWANGYAIAWTFMLMAHYGFFPDDEIPTGRVNPYIGVGPAIVWTGINQGSLGIGSGNSTNVALVTEVGIRWVALKNVSFDTAMRYRYVSPSYEFGNVTVSTDGINMFTVLLRANYHF